MSVSIMDVFSKKNLNLVVGLITLLVVLWVIMFAIPNLFFTLFHTGLGNLILLAIIFLAAIYNANLAIGLFIVLFVLYRSFHMGVENFIL